MSVVYSSSYKPVLSQVFTTVSSSGTIATSTGNAAVTSWTFGSTLYTKSSNNTIIVPKAGLYEFDLLLGIGGSSSNTNTPSYGAADYQQLFMNINGTATTAWTNSVIPNVSYQRSMSMTVRFKTVVSTLDTGISFNLTNGSSTVIIGYTLSGTITRQFDT